MVSGGEADGDHYTLPGETPGRWFRSTTGYLEALSLEPEMGRLASLGDSHLQEASPTTRSQNLENVAAVPLLGRVAPLGAASEDPGSDRSPVGSGLFCLCLYLFP